MRWNLFSLLGLGISVLGSATAVAQPADVEFPYAAFVEFEDVYVRSGPGDSHYPTQRLPRGTQVDVYKIEGDGWCAVRPPEGSFCWLPAEQLRRTDDSQIAEVAADNAVAWIGSEIRSIDDYRYQVRLKRGELVTVIEEKQIEGKQKWCKIQPPAGDFRWIYRQFLSRTPIDISSVPAPPPKIAAKHEPAKFVARSDSRPIDRQPAANSAPAIQFQPRSFPSSVQPASAEIEEKRDETSKEEQAAAPQTESNVGLDNPGETPSGLNPTQQRLSALDLRLSLMAAQPIESWRLDPLHQEVLTLVENGSTVVDRGRARLLLEKIDKFRDVYQRQLRLHQAAPGLINVTEASPLTPLRPVATVGANAALPVDPSPAAVVSPFARYDGQGWLMTIVAEREGTPTYALVDETGRILQFVTPAPGLNLHRYLKQKIGVIGQRSYLPQLGAHVTAHRVVVLSR